MIRKLLISDCDSKRASRYSTGTSRSGVTIVEVLVVTALTTVLVGLVSAGVMRSREAARRIDCVSRLHQLGVAVTNSESTRGRYPTLNGASSPNNCYYRLTEASGNAVPDSKQIGALLPSHLFSCPSDPYAAENTERPLSLGVLEYVWTSYSYVPCGGAAICQSRLLDGRDDGYVSAGQNERTAKEFSDGTSHTVAFSERLAVMAQAAVVSPSPDSQPRRHLHWTARRVPWNPGAEDEFAMTCRQNRTTPLPALSAEPFTWGLAYGGYDHLLGPNEVGCRNGGVETYSLRSGEVTIPASSLHAGGVNVLYVDGHVAFVADGVDLGVWRAMATRAGSETVSAFLD